MVIGSHASCGPIVDINPDGSVRVSRMLYTKNGVQSVRHIMETGKNGDSIEETLKEGLFKEGAKDRSNFAIDILESSPIHFDFVPDEKRPGMVQMKVAIPVFVRADQLRDFEVRDDDDPNESHGPLAMVEAGALLRADGRWMPPFHRNTTLAVLAWASKKDRKVYERYDNYILSWRPKILTEEERHAVNIYTAKWAA